MPLSVDVAHDHLGPADLHLVALAPHRLDEHRELELAPAGHLDHIRRVGVGQPDRHVAEHLALEALAEVARGDVGAVLAGQRRRVGAERHAEHRFVDAEPRQRLGSGGTRERVTDLDLGEAGQHEQVAGYTVIDVDTPQPLEAEQVREPARHRRLAFSRLFVEEHHVLTARSVPRTTRPTPSRPR